jgi:two-component system, chemotaxis family, chemotaxis protein CheY
MRSTLSTRSHDAFSHVAISNPPMKFLVVDDSATMRRIVVNSLQRIGFSETVEAADGAEALAKFDGSINFVITDWNMPNMSGTELTKALRLRDDARDVPVLMVTARSVRDDILVAMEAGVNNYIVKPFTPQVLKEKIDAILPAAA